MVNFLFALIEQQYRRTLEQCTYIIASNTTHNYYRTNNKMAFVKFVLNGWENEIVHLCSDSPRSNPGHLVPNDSEVLSRLAPHDLALTV